MVRGGEPQRIHSFFPGIKQAAMGWHDNHLSCCGTDAASVQQRDVKKEKEGAMNTIIQDGMRVTAANRQAWVEICQCPLSLVSPVLNLILFVTFMI